MINTLKNITNTLKSISISRKEYGNLKDYQLERLKICKKCPHNSDNKNRLTIKEKLLKQLNKLLDFLYGIKVTEDAICTLCGCNLIHKTSQKSENCDINKW